MGFPAFSDQLVKRWHFFPPFLNNFIFTDLSKKYKSGKTKSVLYTKKNINTRVAKRQEIYFNQ